MHTWARVDRLAQTGTMLIAKKKLNRALDTDQLVLLLFGISLAAYPLVTDDAGLKEQGDSSQSSTANLITRALTSW
jgi:hypothetical protein